jgi:hypothetical protein
MMKNIKGNKMKKVYHWMASIGKSFLIVDVLVVIAIVFQSFSTKGKVDYGDRCYVLEDFSALDNYEKDGIELLNSSLKCNMYVMNYKSQLDSKGDLLFLSDLSKILFDNSIKADISVSIVSINHQIIASIVDYKVSYVETQI